MARRPSRLAERLVGEETGPYLRTEQRLVQGVDHALGLVVQQPRAGGPGRDYSDNPGDPTKALHTRIFIGPGDARWAA